MYWVIDVFVCTGIPISAYILYYTLRDNLVFVYGLLTPKHLNQCVWLIDESCFRASAEPVTVRERSEERRQRH